MTSETIATVEAYFETFGTRDPDHRSALPAVAHPEAGAQMSKTFPVGAAELPPIVRPTQE